MGVRLPHTVSPVTGTVSVPGSKSETNRALVLAAVAAGTSRVVGALASRDSDLMVEALRALGVEIIESEGQLVVSPPPVFSSAPDGIDCGLAGTVMRFVPPLTLFSKGPTAFVGDAHASQRPMAGLLDGLRQLGARVDADQLPFTVVPPDRISTSRVIVDASASSQFISGLLLVGARLPHGLHLTHEGASVPSRPHIDMTVEMLRSRGVTIDQPDDLTWMVAPGTIQAMDTRIEPDLTNASAFLGAAMLTGGSVRVAGWPKDSLQPGAHFLDVAARMGAEVEVDAQGALVTMRGELRSIDVDLHAASELTPVVAAIATRASGTSRITGVGHIRGHETDRLKALATEFSKLGIDIAETSDGLVIRGSGQQLEPRGPFETYADHRMVHSAALLALNARGLQVTDLECVSKTMPDFEDRWTGLVP